MKIKSKKYNQYILLLSSFIYFIVWAQFSDSFDPIRPDSSGYLNFFSGTEDGANRLSGYPIFLLILSKLKFELIHIGYFQLGIFVFALYYFLNSLLKFRVNKIIVALLFIGLILNPFFNQFHFTILTESLSFSFLLIFLGLSLSLYTKITNTKISIFGMVIGLLAILKPVSLIFLPIGLTYFFLLLWIFNSSFSQKIILYSVLFCAHFLIIFSLEKMVFSHAHEEKGSQFTEHFYGKSILSTTYSSFGILDDGTPESQMLKLLDDEYSNDQKYLESIEDLSEKLAIYSLLENDAYKYPSLEDELVLIASSHGLEPIELKRSIIFYSLKNNPTVFLRMMFRHYFSFFNVYPSGKYFNENGSPQHLINKEIDFSPSITRDIVHHLFLIFGAVFYLCSILIFIKFFYLIFQKSFLNYVRDKPLYLLALLLTILVHSIHFSHALFGVYVPRYLMFSYPYIILLELITIYQLLKNTKIRFNNS